MFVSVLFSACVPAPTAKVAPTEPPLPTLESTAVPTVILAFTPTATLPSAGKIIATISVGARPLTSAFGEGAVWLRNGSGEVLRIDPSANQVVATIQVGGGEYGYITVREVAVGLPF